jgi:hypothetical protein
MSILNESVPTTPSPERPPLAPYDPPDPAPQAEAWRRALKVVTGAEPRSGSGTAQTRVGTSQTRVGTSQTRVGTSRTRRDDRC